MAVYVAADAPLPIIPDARGTAFYTSPLRQKSDEPVRQQFSKRHVVYAGSYEGCGCGFYTLEHAEYREEEEVEACRRSLAALGAYLDDASRRLGSIEVFTCWEGDQGRSAESRGVLSPKDVASGALKWNTRQFVTLRPPAPA